jgi:hypothetical protein
MILTPQIYRRADLMVCCNPAPGIVDPGDPRRWCILGACYRHNYYIV